MARNCAEVVCINNFRDTVNIKDTFNNIWAEIINYIENDSNTDYNLDRQRHACLDNEVR